ncbi:MAG: TraR/DksA C4-type zinc finger protein [Gammaproteobacteria bacterium]|jgi:RNA polymerase-binding transcription factor DksA|nr:TraR/DksA C4-type zinc finger protein [Gammaproteobacteria bacterium]
MTEDTIRSQLEARLAEMRQRLEAIKKDVTRAHSGDSAEQAQERENDEVIDAIGNETAHSIALIQAALERINNGTYGLCDHCGSQISEVRLRALPETTRCLDCAE